MKLSFISSVAAVAAMFAIVSLSTAPVEARTICKGSGDSATCYKVSATKKKHAKSTKRSSYADRAGTRVGARTRRVTRLAQRGTPALSRASITQGEAASITAHGGSATLQECMALWDAGAHMSMTEWKAACKRTMVWRSVERPL